MAPNWDRDFDDDANDFESESRRQHEPEIERRRRNLYGRADRPTRPQRTWNGKSVYEMETDHILNAIMFCEKRFAEAKQNHQVCFPNHEAANQFYFKSPFEMFPEYIHLRNEWDERSTQ